MRAATIPVDELIAYLFDGGQGRLATDVRASVLASKRFRLFVETHRDKIRKKARGSRDEEAQQDLAFELAVAALLVDDARFTLEYEPSGVGQRSADFRLTFRGGVRCNIEARRLRSLRVSSDAGLRAQVTRSLCDKLGQLAPGMMNVIAFGTTDPVAMAVLLEVTVHQLEEHAAAKDDALFQQRGFTGARDFLRQYRRLSGVLWVGTTVPPWSTVWVSPQARHALPPALARALERPR